MLFKPFALTDKVQRTTWVDDHGVLGDRDIVYVFFMGMTFSGKQFKIRTKLSDANSWINGELIQSAFPYLDAEQREILKTGFDDECWNSMFAESEEETV